MSIEVSDRKTQHHSLERVILLEVGAGGELAEERDSPKGGKGGAGRLDRERCEVGGEDGSRATWAKMEVRLRRCRGYASRKGKEGAAGRTEGRKRPKMRMRCGLLEGHTSISAGGRVNIRGGKRCWAWGGEENGSMSGGTKKDSKIGSGKGRSLRTETNGLKEEIKVQ